jgi:hypothetical protein
MSGCSLQEAFPDTAAQSGQKAKRDERAKAKRCGGPALAFLKATGDLDPDRQSMVPLPPAEKLQGREGFTAASMIQGVSSSAPTGANEFSSTVESDPAQDKAIVASLMGQKVDDVIGGKVLPAAAGSTSQLPPMRSRETGNPVPSYFGKGSGEAGFADYSKFLTDNTGYQIQGADFLGSFAQGGLDKAAGLQNLPIPTVNNAWKPITQSGANTSFFETPSSEYDGISAFSKDEKESLLKKLDVLFARLEEMESKANQYAHVEVSMFILSGLVLLFGLETVRKMR